MHISLNSRGQVVQSGEGMYRVPMGADEVDNTLSSPITQANDLIERNRIEYTTMAAHRNARAARARAMGQAAAFQQKLAAEYEEFVSQEAAEANGGENPLLYAAAMQSMAGGAEEQNTPLGGYLLSQDGQLAYDRSMSGDFSMRGLGQVSQLIASAQSDIQQAQAAAAPLVALVNGSGTSSSPVSAAPASSSLSTMLAPYLAMKVGGIPVPYLAGGLLALLILKRK